MLLERVPSAAVVRFFEPYVVELEKHLRMGDQHGFVQNIKPTQLEERKMVEPWFVTRKEECCEMKGVSARDVCDPSARC